MSSGTKNTQKKIKQGLTSNLRSLESEEVAIGALDGVIVGALDGNCFANFALRVLSLSIFPIDLISRPGGQIRFIAGGVAGRPGPTES